MRHLLTHTGGWVGDYFAEHGSGDDALARIVEDLPKLPQLTPLGEVWSYNNAGFYVAGRVSRSSPGSRTSSVVAELLLEPLGLEHSLFFADEDVMTRASPSGHHRVPTRPRRSSPGRGRSGAPTMPPAGSHRRCVDLLRYARFHLVATGRGS